MSYKLNNRREVLWPKLPVLGLNLQYLGIQLIGLHAFIEKVEHKTRAKAQNQRVGCHDTSLASPTRAQLGVIIHLNTTELAAIGIEFGKAIKP